ncbi:MAG: 8-oxoguanine deaminase [Anaerolineae bacterium]|nr:8-oxoguanine deaminase [Anaerolineae bacterium]
MPTLLLKNIGHLVTMDDQRREIKDAAVLLRDNVIVAVGTTAELGDTPADEVRALPNHVVLPGMVNTHHHMFQNLTRAIAQEFELFGWLTTLYKIWRTLTPEMIHISAKVAMTELILSGCTTSSDHLYLYLNGAQIDDEIRAATELGFRFHPTRGSMSVGESKGGLPPDDLVQDEKLILKDTQRAIETFHDNSRYSMLRVGVAPTAPFNVSQDLMREAAALARSVPGVRLHTHLAENVNDIAYSLEHFGMRPGQYAESVGWLGDDVWHAHCVQLDAQEIHLFAHTHTGVAHCPCSNMRLASGIAPVRQMLAQGVRVGLGVDGSASNDSGHLLNEARQAMLLQRVAEPNPNAMSARQALEVATRGGASVLGRDDIGQIAVGYAADIVGWRTDTLGFTGAWHDVAAGLLFTTSQNVDFSIINGKTVVRDGQMVSLDLPMLVERHTTLSKKLIGVR